MSGEILLRGDASFVANPPFLHTESLEKPTSILLFYSTMSSLRLSAALIVTICITSDAFTASPHRRLFKASPFVSPLGVSKTIPDLSSATRPTPEASIDDDISENESSWQENLDVLLAPDTSVAERQIMLSDLLSSGKEIQESVRTALREGKVNYLSVFVHLISSRKKRYIPVVLTRCQSSPSSLR
jgi:hypothetical protein